jgi:GxxExxY protein
MIERELIGKRVLDCAMAVHSGLGPGLLESVYEACMFYELTRRGLEVQRQVVLPIRYKDVEIANGFRLDLLVERKVVLELKVVEGFNDVHLAQMLSYLKLGKFGLGYLLNFNVRHMKHGIKRVVN